MTIASTVVTALATVALAVLTFVLARATYAMARANSQPHVVVTFESNQWSMNHIDMIVENCGNAPAYDISISFNPTLPKNELRTGDAAPFDKISLLRPGQLLKSSASDWASVKDIAFTVDISWRRYPNNGQREVLSYQFDVGYLKNVSMLGNASPEVQIATEVKKLRDDWRGISAGTRRLKVDSFSEQDRATQQTQREGFVKQQVARNAKAPEVGSKD